MSSLDLEIGRHGYYFQNTLIFKWSQDCIVTGYENGDIDVIGQNNNSCIWLIKGGSDKSLNVKHIRDDRNNIIKVIITNQDGITTTL